MPPIQIDHNNIHNNNDQGDAFVESSGPIIYMTDNRMPVIMDPQSCLIYVFFGSLLLALIIIVPGLRRTKVTTLMTGSIIIVSGASIMLALNGSHWLSGNMKLNQIQFNRGGETLTGRLEIDIGLSWVNVTLSGHLSGVDSTSAQEKSIHLNERFEWDEPYKMMKNHNDALTRGLPYPLLSVTEYLSQGWSTGGFTWTNQLRTAGYYSKLSLYVSLANWCSTIIVLCALPKFLPHMLQLTGFMMLITAWTYCLLVDSPWNSESGLRIAGQKMNLEFGYNFIIIFWVGVSTLIVGFILFAIHLYKPHEQLTAFDTDQYKLDQKKIYSHEIDRSKTKKPIWTCDMNLKIHEAYDKITPNFA